MDQIITAKFIFHYSREWAHFGKVLLNRDCRQGDPVSPYIRVISTEIMAVALRENRVTEGIKVCNKRTEIIFVRT